MTTYTYEQAVEDSESYFGDNLPAKVFVNKYALRDNDGNILENTPKKMHRRIAKEFARIEKKKFKDPLTEEEIFLYLDKFGEIIPQGSLMYGVGNKHQYISLSNCFVLDEPEDSYNGIMHTDTQLVNVAKRRGGNGISLNNLRPTGTPTRNSSRTSTGILSWMERYSNSTREVGQANRRGALMLTLNVHHPDILKFINAKRDKTKVTGANVSVQYTDEFLNAVEHNKKYTQQWPVDIDIPDIYQEVDANEIWNQAVDAAWDNAEPGVQFIDNILKESPADCYAAFGFKTVTTNPCSELPLSVLDSCRLLVINLMSCVKDAFKKSAEFLWDKFAHLAKIAQRLMDDVIDLEIECVNRIIKKVKADPESDFIKRPEIELWERVKQNCINGRRTGTGITGLGDVFASLGIVYGSNDSVELTDKIFKELKLNCYSSSVEMAKELGAFPIFDSNLEKDNPFLLRIKDEDPLLYADMQKYGRRNIALLTVAPTGSVSIVAGYKVGEGENEKYYHNISSGIEPCFMASYTRRTKINHDDTESRVDYIDDMGDKWSEFKVYHSGVEAYADVNNNPEDLDDNNPYIHSLAEKINWIRRVEIQAAAQQHIDHSISSTVNLPNSATREDIDTIFRAAWKTGLKGITVYRDGCRSGVLIKEEKTSDFTDKKRPRELTCDVHHTTIKGTGYFVLVGILDGEPYEVFAGKNGFLPKNIKEGKIIRKRKGFYKADFGYDEAELAPITACMSEEEEIISRFTSALLQTNSSMHFIVSKLEKVGETKDINSFARCIARVLKKYIPDGTKDNEQCPECGSEVHRQEGCKTCASCGWSKCL